MRLHPFEPGVPILPALLWMVLRIYIALLLILWIGQEVLLFPGLWLLRGQPTDAAWAETLEAPRPDGSTVPVLTANLHHDRIVLLTHGNGESAADMADYARVLNSLGWGFAAMEFRGYAGVPGWPTEHRLGADLRSVSDALVARGFPPERTVLHGRSIGGGVAGTLLEHSPPAGLVLESSFDSLFAVANSRWVGWIAPIRLLLRSPFHTAQRLSAHPVPVFRVHDTTDGVIDLAQARGVAVQDLIQHTTTGYPHGAPIVLLDQDVFNAWSSWLNRVVPAQR